MKTLRTVVVGTAMIVVVIEAVWAFGFVLFLGDAMIFGLGPEDGTAPPSEREVLPTRVLMWTVVAGALVQAAWVWRSLGRRLEVRGSAPWGIGCAIVAHIVVSVLSVVDGSGWAAWVLWLPLCLLLLAGALTRDDGARTTGIVTAA
ncbi:hypothetical protein [Embleya sp. NPDC059259]|uniref:hypothetical protein n=1 Tax=unclassified Embleya TaxID=2699296 RepID=UPI0036B322E5